MGRPAMAYVPELLDYLSIQSSTASNASDDILLVSLRLNVLCGVASCCWSRERKTAVGFIVYNMQQLNIKAWNEGDEGGYGKCRGSVFSGHHWLR